MSAHRRWQPWLGLSLLLAALPAGASDSKTFPGTFCRPLHGTGGQLVYHLDGSISNASTTAELEVVCPILRDNTREEQLGFFTSVHLVSDLSGMVMCALTTHELFGEVHAADSDSAAGTDVLEMYAYFQVIDGYSSLHCTLPPAEPVGGVTTEAHLVMYLTREVSGEDTDTDSKTFSGSFVEKAGTHVLPPPSVGYDVFGRALRTGPDRSPRWVIPFVRDTVAQPWDWSRLRVSDRSSTSDFLCDLTAYNEDGTVADVVPGVQDRPEGNATVLFGAGGGTATATYVATCTVPSGPSGLVMYDIRER